MHRESPILQHLHEFAKEQSTGELRAPRMIKGDSHVLLVINAV